MIDLFIFDLLLLLIFNLHRRFKVWIELLDLSDSLKYFIPSEPISFTIPNILQKKKGLEKMELIRRYFDNNNLIIIYIS